jgi:hypothetical protein
MFGLVDGGRRRIGRRLFGREELIGVALSRSSQVFVLVVAEESGAAV